jgi:hypothetical protein|tara:strand:- start:2951 stop:5080 length:2130 start_codon:yes stop_codon:yes gene_type:complete
MATIIGSQKKAIARAKLSAAIKGRSFSVVQSGGRTYTVSDGRRTDVSTDDQPRGQANAVTEIDSQQAAQEFAKAQATQQQAEAVAAKYGSAAVQGKVAQTKAKTVIEIDRSTRQSRAYVEQPTQSSYRAIPDFKPVSSISKWEAEKGVSGQLSETKHSLDVKHEKVLKDYKKAPTFKSAFLGGVAYPVAKFGLGVSRGLAGVGHAVIHPIDTVMGITYAVTHPLETGQEIGTQFAADPVGTAGEFVGIGGGIKILSRTAKLGLGRVRSIGAKHIPAEKVFDPGVLAGESTFPRVSIPREALTQFERGEVLVSTTADFPSGAVSKVKKRVGGTVEITKTKIADPNVAGLYGSPKSRASPAFLRLDKAASSAYSDISFIPKWRSPKVLEVKPTEFGRTPRNILSEDVRRIQKQGKATRLVSSEEFISAKAEKGSAILGPRLELGLTSEPEAILGLGGKIKQKHWSERVIRKRIGDNWIIEKWNPDLPFAQPKKIDILSVLRGYGKYTKYKPEGKFFSEIVPIEEFEVIGSKPSKTPRVKSEFGIKGGKYDVGSSSAVKPSRSVAGLGSELSILSGSSSKLFGSSSSPFGSSSRVFGSSSRTSGLSSSYPFSSRAGYSGSSIGSSLSSGLSSGLSRGSSSRTSGLSSVVSPPPPIASSILRKRERKYRVSQFKFKPRFKTFASPTAVLFNIKASKRQRKKKQFTGLEIIGLR